MAWMDGWIYLRTLLPLEHLAVLKTNAEHTFKILYFNLLFKYSEVASDNIYLQFSTEQVMKRFIISLAFETVQMVTIQYPESRHAAHFQGWTEFRAEVQNNTTRK